MTSTVLAPKQSFDEAYAWLSENFTSPDMVEQHFFAYRNIAATVGKYLSPGARILDFGCGSCDKTAILQRMGYPCTGYDDLQDLWYQEGDNIAKIRQFTEKCGIEFVNASERTFPFPDETFDMVMAHDVIEHLHHSPRLLLNRMLQLLKPGGYLFITVPNAVNIRKRIAVLLGGTNYPPYEHFYWYPEPWRGHVREYVRDDLDKLARYLNLTPVELRACDHLLFRVPAKIRPLYLLGTFFFQGWKDSWMLVARKEPGWQPDMGRLTLQELSAKAGVGVDFSD